MRVRFMSLILICVAALTLASAAQTTPAQTMLEAARKQEVVDGDVKGAIQQYQFIADRYGKTDRAVAAQALLKMAQVYEKLADPRAREVYARIVDDKDLADTSAAATARTRIEPTSSTRGSTAPRMVWGKASGLEQGGITADGRLAAIVREDGAIGLRDLVAGETKWLDVGADPDDDVQWPVLSPDRSAVVYAHDRRKELTSLWVVGTAFGARPRLLVRSSEFRAVEPFAWSPDGKSILVTTVRQDQTWQVAWVSASDGRMTTLRSLDWRFFYTFGVSLSPDGRFVAYAALPESPVVRTVDVVTRSDTHIYVVPADGVGPEVEIVRTAGHNVFPAWTSDGRHLLFLNARNLWAVPMSGGTAAGPAALVRGNVDSLVQGLGVTRSGTFNYLTGVSTPVVSVVSRAGENRARVIDSFAGSGPIFSPDGKSVALVRGDGEQQRIVVHTLATGDERSWPLKDAVDRARPANLVWLPDGSGLLTGFEAATPGLNSRLAWRRLDLASDQSTEVSPADANEVRGEGVVSPDGQTFYFSATRLAGDSPADEIVALDMATHTRRVVVSRPRHAGGRPFPGLSDLSLRNDGRVLAFRQGVAATGGMHYWHVGVDGGDAREFFNAGAKNFWVLGWDRDGRSLLYAPWALAGEPMPLMRISIEDGAAETLEPDILSAWKAPAGASGFPKVSFSRDGKQLAISTTGWVQELWAIDNVSSVVQQR